MNSHAANEFTKDFRRRTPQEVCFFGKHGHWPEEESDVLAEPMSRVAIQKQANPETIKDASSSQTFFPPNALKQASFTKR